MKITIIAGYYPPEQSADTRLNQDLVESLISMGLKVTLIVPYPSRGIDEKTRNEYLHKKYEKISNNFEIYRVGGFSKYQQGIITRGISFLLKSYKLYCMAKKIETDIYLVISTPPTLGYVAALLAKDNKVIYKLQDVFPDSLIHAKSMSDKNFIIIFLRYLEGWIYKSVPRIIAISDDLKQTLLKRGVPENKITVIYDWIDENVCRPIERKNNFLFDKFKLDKEKFYVVYAGNIGLLQNIETFIKAAKVIAEKNLNILFVIIGDGSWKDEMLKILQAGSYPNVFYFPMQPTKDIAYVYSLGNVGLVSLKPNVTKIALPSKTWDIMSAGRAVLCEIDLYSGLCKIVKESRSGYCIAPNDVGSMVEAILKMYDKKEETTIMGKNGRDYILNHLTRSIEVNKYVKVFQEEMESYSK